MTAMRRMMTAVVPMLLLLLSITHPIPHSRATALALATAAALTTATATLLSGTLSTGKAAADTARPSAAVLC